MRTSAQLRDDQSQRAGSLSGATSSGSSVPPRLHLSACNREDRKIPAVASSAYPAAPDSEYGWEKLFGERLYLAYNRNFGMECCIARYHNIFGPEGTWEGGREKVPAAICRMVAQAPDGGAIEIWGDGEQTRSFLYIDECIEGTIRLTRSGWAGPVNIGSDEMISINQLVEIVMRIAGKHLTVNHIAGPIGVRGRNSDNRLVEERLGWKPAQSWKAGLEKTYSWVAEQVDRKAGATRKR
jgi:nucleoside-diphosphate-sugar epimerase